MKYFVFVKVKEEDGTVVWEYYEKLSSLTKEELTKFLIKFGPDNYLVIEGIKRCLESGELK